MRRGGTALAGLCVLAAWGLAPVSAWSRDKDEEDAEFASALIGRGYLDLADELTLQLVNAASTPAKKGNALLYRAELLYALAQAESDVTKGQAIVDQAIALLRDFVKANAGAPSAGQVRAALANLQSKQAQILINVQKVEPDPAKATAMRNRAMAIFGEIESELRTVVKGLKEQALKAPPTDESDRILIDYSMQFVKTLLEHGRMAGGEDRKALLDEAIKLAEDFQYDFGNRSVAFDVLRIEGLCRMELGDFTKAEQRIKSALTLRDQLPEKSEPNDFQLGILRDAHLALVQLYLKSGRHLQAVEAVDRAFAVDPKLKGTDPGWTLQLEKAQGYASMGDLVRATATANQIIAANPNGRNAYLARERMTTWITVKGRATPDRLMTAAESYLDREQWREALSSFRRVIELSTAPADRDKYAPTAYYKMGQCLLEMGRHGEAAYAFENVVRDFASNENAPRACFEAMRCAQRLVNLSNDPRDEAWKDQFLNTLSSKWPTHPSARNVKFIQAEKAETAGDLPKAADLYRQVPEDAELYEGALVRAGFCYYQSAATRWEKEGKTDRIKPEIQKQMQMAEEVFKKFLARLGKPELEPKVPELVKQRAGFVAVANQFLAYVYMHEVIGRAADAVQLLDESAKPLAANDDKLAKIWEVKVRALLNMGKLDEAVQVLESLYQRFPDGLPIARACKSVAVRLDQATADLEKAGGDPKVVRENLKRVSRYYTTWLNEGPSNGLRVTMGDVVSVSEALYITARRLNGLTEKQSSFLDLKGQQLPEPQYWKDAAFVHTLLADERIGKLNDAERLKVFQRLARCTTFIASEAQDWLRAKNIYSDIFKSYQLVNARDELNVAVLQKHPALLGLYIELGYVYIELARCKQKFQYDNAMTVFNNLLRVAQPGSEPWWICKFAAISALYERGGSGDITTARVAMENVERNYPDYDGGTYGLKAKFLELKPKVMGR
jgi:tetratricopeptide (TPR) repeat protein